VTIDKKRLAATVNRVTELRAAIDRMPQGPDKAAATFRFERIATELAQGVARQTRPK
jgi:hypothetical protein